MMLVRAGFLLGGVAIDPKGPNPLNQSLNLNPKPPKLTFKLNPRPPKLNPQVRLAFESGSLYPSHRHLWQRFLVRRPTWRGLAAALGLEES